MYGKLTFSKELAPKIEESPEKEPEDNRYISKVEHLRIVSSSGIQTRIYPKGKEKVEYTSLYVFYLTVSRK